MHEERDAYSAKINYKGEPTQAKTIDAAYFAEFGMGQPQRSWLRAWFDQNLDRLKTESTAAMRAEFNGDGNAVPLLAKKWAQEVRDALISGSLDLAPLSPRTIEERRKAGIPDGPPLVATHQLVEAVHGLADAEVVG
jgi:hypothetical protein